MSVYLWNIELIPHHPAALDGTVGNGQNLAVFHALKAGIWRLLTLPPGADETYPDWLLSHSTGGTVFLRRSCRRSAKASLRTCLGSLK